MFNFEIFQKGKKYFIIQDFGSIELKILPGSQKIKCLFYLFDTLFIYLLIVNITNINSYNFPIEKHNNNKSIRVFNKESILYLINLNYQA